jgi:uncharacterized protein (TIGR02678 family)
MTESLSTAADVTERRRALRALLMHPLLVASGPHAAEAALVRRHAGWLREWLARHPGWTLQVDSEIARLRKTPPDLFDGTRPARDPLNAVAFNRRRYVLLCLSLAALERGDRQTALGRLAEDVVGLVAADPALSASGIEFNMSKHDQRRDLVHVIRLLLHLRVLARVQGDEQQFLDEVGDVLYNVNRPALASILAVKRGPSTIDEPDIERRLALLVDEPVPNTDEGRNRRIRSRVTRMLLDDPVAYHDALDSEAKTYLMQQRGQIARQIEEATGLVPEVRREGIAMVDLRGDLTDIGLPEEGTEGHLTLLLAEHLAGHARRSPDAAVEMTALYKQTARLVDQHRAHWRKSVTQPGGEIAATDATVDRLVALRLARRVENGVVPLPAIARYALQPPSAPGARADRRRGAGVAR